MTDEEELLSVNMAVINFLKLMVRKNNRWFSDKKVILFHLKLKLKKANFYF